MSIILFVTIVIFSMTMITGGKVYANDQVKIGNRWFDKHTPTALELNDLKVTTHGVHDWLQRPDGTICMNPLSPTTVITQKTWPIQIDYVKTHGGQLNYLDNPWPLLCSTNLSQALDYYSVYVNHK
jgi:hypothetical protein